MQVILRKNGFYVKKWRYDEKKEEGCYEEEKIENIDIFHFWNTSLKIDGSLTLLNIVELFQGENLLNIGKLSNCNISNFIKELYEEPKEENLNLTLESIDLEKKSKKIDFIEISKSFNVDHDSIISQELNASGKQNNNLIENWSLDFTNWFHFRNIPIFIKKDSILFDERKFYKKRNKNFIDKILQKIKSNKIKKRNEKLKKEGSNYTEWDIESELDYVMKFNKKYKGEKLKTEITLGEFLTAIFFELGWHNSPEDRNRRLEELKDILDGCKNQGELK